MFVEDNHTGKKLPPLVSVILPTYNRRSLVGRSIQSVLNQSFDRIELIIVDDASTDGTDEVIREFDDPRIIYIKHHENKGGAAARNTGIQAAKGEFIAFQDSDDEWLPEKLDKQMNIMEKSPSCVGVVYTGFWRFRDGKKEYIPGADQQIKEGNIHQELLRGNFITTQAVVIKKECFHRAGMFDEYLPRLQDWELFIRISKYYEFRYIPEPLVHSFFTEGSISSNKKAYTEALDIILTKHFEYYSSDKILYSKKLIELANLYHMENKLAESRSCLMKAFKASRKITLILPIILSWIGIGAYNCYWQAKKHWEYKNKA